MDSGMALKIGQLVSIVLSALVMGVFWGPWLALSRSIATFESDTFLAVVKRLSLNIAPLMTFLMPAALLSIVPVLFLAYHKQPTTFFLNLTGLALFATALLVTMLIEVPIVKQMETWTVSTLPDNWQALRDRWAAFHIIRVAASIAGLILLVVGALF